MLVAPRKPAKKQADRETESAAAEDRGGGRVQFPLEMVDQVERMVRSFGFFRSGVRRFQERMFCLYGAHDIRNPLASDPAPHNLR